MISGPTWVASKSKAWFMVASRLPRFEPKLRKISILTGNGLCVVECFVGEGDSVWIDDGLLFEFGLEEVELLVEFIDAEDDSEDDESPFEQTEGSSEESVDPSELDGFEQFGQESSCDIKRNGNA